MSDLLDEVKEELKQERINKIVFKYGPYIIGLIIFGVLMFAAGLWFFQKDQELDAELTEKIHNAYVLSQESKIEDAIKEYDFVIKHHKKDISIIADLMKAGLLIDQKKYQEAIDCYKHIKLVKPENKTLESLALLLEVGISVNNNIEVDEKSFADLDKSDWTVSENEIKAAMLLNKGMRDDAIKALKAIILDQKSSESLKNRAKQMLVVL
jgi:hypothetical protein